jgi:hypothetical protein
MSSAIDVSCVENEKEKKNVFRIVAGMAKALSLFHSKHDYSLCLSCLICVYENFGFFFGKKEEAIN